MPFIKHVEQSKSFLAGDRMVEKLAKAFEFGNEPVIRTEYRVWLIHSLVEDAQGNLTRRTTVDMVVCW